MAPGRNPAYDGANRNPGGPSSARPAIRHLVPAAASRRHRRARLRPRFAAEFSPELKEVIAAAKNEGAVSLVWGEGTLGGTSGAKLFEQQINKMFGTDIRITFTPGASMPQIGNDIAMRQAAGQPSLHRRLYRLCRRAVAARAAQAVPRRRVGEAAARPHHRGMVDRQWQQPESRHRASRHRL